MYLKYKSTIEVDIHAYWKSTNRNTYEANMCDNLSSIAITIADEVIAIEKKIINAYNSYAAMTTNIDKSNSELADKFKNCHFYFQMYCAGFNYKIFAYKTLKVQQIGWIRICLTLLLFPPYSLLIQQYKLC